MEKNPVASMSIKTFPKALAEALVLFKKNDPLRMAGATAFFTMFALPPILILLVQLFSLVIDPQAIRKEVFVGLSGTFGEEAVKQIITVIRAFRKLTYNWPATIIGFIFLSFVATTLFKVIKDSIIQIWDIHPHHDGRKAITTLESRLKSLLLIFITGLLFSVGVLLEALQVVVGDIVFKFFPSLSDSFNQVQAFLLSTLIIAFWFLLIFRFLSGGRPSWRTAWAGAIFTSILFSIAKIILHKLLSYSNVNNIYGTSASVVLLLLFLFYSAMILYYGAAFTKVWATHKGENMEAIETPEKAAPHA